MQQALVTEAPISHLSKSDRCDRCGAEAKVRAILPSGGELLFCSHHYQKFEAGLAKRKVDVIHAR